MDSNNVGTADQERRGEEETIIAEEIPSREDMNVLWPSFRKYWLYVFAALSLSFLGSAFEGASVGLLIPFLQTLSDSASGGFQTQVAWIDEFVLASDASQLERMYRICAIILVATLLRAVFLYFGDLCSHISRVRIVEDLRMRIVDQLSSVSLRYFGKTRTGELLNSILTEVGRTTTALGVILSIIQRSVMVLIFFGLMVWISWELSLLVISCFLVLSVSLTRLITIVRQRGDAITLRNGEFTSALTEFIHGMRTITSFNMQAWERKRLARSARNVADAAIEAMKYHLLVGPISTSVTTILLLSLVVVAVQYLVLPGLMDMAFLLTFLFALFRIIPVVNQINVERGVWAKNRGGLKNVAALLRTEDKPYLPNGTHPAPSLERGFTFDDVSFAYEPGQPVLHDVNLRIQKGKTTALVGASGAGKSTLADLIPRFYDPTEGRILYDDHDLRSLDVVSLRNRIAIVSQSTHVFNDTAAANIAYGKPDASFEEIQDAARQANALEFITEMEDGFETMLGEHGVRLSGGQRQRIAIARCLLCDPEILILDEATSALDSVSERLVQSSLERLMEGRTVIAIAHRLSTIENADWVVVLEEGRIVEQGLYDDLIEERGQLWEYHSIQYQVA